MFLFICTVLVNGVAAFFRLTKQVLLLRFTDSRRGAFDDPMELLRRARIRFRSTKLVLLAREQFVKNVWNCTRTGFGARKPPAERSSRPNV